MTKLVFVGEPFAGRVYELMLEKTTVGRGDANTLTIHDPSISLAHCEILVHGPEVIVRDLGSANGTWVDRIRLDHQQSQIKSGQFVRFGSVEARLELDPAVEHYGDSEITAIHEMGRIMRDQRREEKRPKPADASLTLDGGAASIDNGHTVMLRGKSQPANVAPSTAPENAEHSEKKSSIKRGVLIIAVILGLTILLWRILSNR